MIASRALGVVLVLAFLGVATQRALRTHPAPLASRAEAARQEQVRRFWDTYRQASQNRADGDLEGAVSSYRAALALKADHEDSLYYLGNSCLELGRYSDAIGAYQRLLAVNRLGSSRGYVQLALVYADRRSGSLYDPQKADRLFRQALQVDPDSGALLGIGEVALLRGEWEQARVALAGDHADNAMGVAAPYLLGYLHWRQGEKSEAWRWFRLAVKCCKVKKPPVKWSEEGDVKADPELRWRALARQSVFGSYWIRLRPYVNSPALSPATMTQEYGRLHSLLSMGASSARQKRRATSR
jgi:tetratricopeptide (TPR) repeat protein